MQTTHAEMLSGDPNDSHQLCYATEQKSLLS
jgi:hypothetical protein